MSGATRVGPALDERLEGLRSVPPEHYLAAGRTARRRRRQRRTGGAIGLVAAGILVATQTLPWETDPQGAREHRPDTVASQGTIEPRSLSNLHVEAGVGAIDSFSTDEIPEWAQEYGNHGPAAIAPDGRLWIAPEAAVVRSIADPVGPGASAAGVAHSYALEVRWQRPGVDLGKDGVVWWYGFQDVDSTATLGSTDDPDRWTSDFALWADNEATAQLDKQSFAERLVRFEDDRSSVLVPRPGVEIVRQVTGVDTGDMEQYARRSAAEVVIDGQTYYVLANGRKVGHDIYEPFEAAVVAPDLTGFLTYVASGFVPRVSAP
jgi:hypothetical protein